MHLKNLTLKGFKSFADTASIDLEPGVTVVVGPNGSGKSNVVDAIAWVLGAQAPSAVRSGKMDDVIFAGTAKKAALGRAEVSLTIDNHSRTLPVEFNEVRITRTLFRNGDSEYAINGVPCRLLDITELLSDGGVGRQQHVIVSQGQIDAVLNARPEDRRAIIEEAAGVLKFRKRKERAERRLSGTDGDLTRVKDLMREVRRQLRPLEKQAEAARRHGDLIAELTALRLHLAGRQVAELRAAAQANSELRSRTVEQERAARQELEQVSTAVTTDENQLSSLGGDDLGDTLARLESLRERSRGLTVLLAERQRGLDREREAFADQTVIANLESELARGRQQLAEVEQERRALAPDVAALAEEEAALARDRVAFQERWGQGAPMPSGEAAEIRGELGALRANTERGSGEAERLRNKLVELDSRRQTYDNNATALRSDLAALRDEEDPLVSAREAAGQALQQAETRQDEAQAALNEAEGALNRWVARAEALSLALDDARARSGAERLSESSGVLGLLLDLVVVEPGWEAAFEAAVGDALRSVVVESPEAARQALSQLAAGKVSGMVLSLGAVDQAPTPVNSALRQAVRSATPEVDTLLDRLLAAVDVVDGGWSQALDRSIEQPGRIVVTRDGDRFSGSGAQLGGGGVGATGAALTEAETEVARFQTAVAEAGEALAAAAAETQTGQARAASLTERLQAIESGRTEASEALQRIDADRRELVSEAEALRSRFEELSSRLEREAARIDELETRLPELEAAEEASVEAGRQLAAARSEIDARAARVGSLRTDVDIRTASLDQQHSLLQQRIAEIDERLERDADQRAAAQDQRLDLDRRAEVMTLLTAAVGRRTLGVEAQLAEIRERRRQQTEASNAITDRLATARARRRELEVLLESLRSALAKAEVEEAELRTRLQGLIDRIRADHDVAPDVAISAPCPELPEEMTPARRTEMLEAELDIMGPVNPLALEEFQELQDRHSFLQGQLDDIRSTRRELQRVITSIDEEIVSVFASAFADVSVNFGQLFETLFPGGTGSISLTTPDDLLHTGIEISAKPSGKNVKKLSLLSGGERTLTALAFLFAVFRSRPSPFYVMDEVEAALDDVNLHRFLSLVEEFRADAQLLLVSHQKRTMEAADCLYGVSMKGGGSSRVVSERVDKDRLAPTVGTPGNSPIG